MDQQLKEHTTLSEEAVSSQHHMVSPVPEDLKPSFGLQGRQEHIWYTFGHTYQQNTHIHKIKTSKSEKCLQCF